MVLRRYQQACAGAGRYGESKCEGKTLSGTLGLPLEASALHRWSMTVANNDINTTGIKGWQTAPFSLQLAQAIHAQLPSRRKSVTS